MDYFKGKVSIVTGGASGIGRALCEALARRGSVVIAADINEDGAAKVAAGVTESGGKAHPAGLDVTQFEQVQDLVDRTVERHGRLDFMFNNAGIATLGEVRDLTPEHWRRVLDVDLWGVINGTLASYRVMAGQGFGHIVNTASLGGLIPVPMITPYSTAKHAVVGLSTSLRFEAAQFGVRVSVVCPGLVNTGLFHAMTCVDIKWDRNILTTPTGIIETGRCARSILGGVRKNQSIIVVPGRSRLVWWFHRLNPALTAPFLRTGVQRMRRLRIES